MVVARPLDTNTIRRALRMPHGLQWVLDRSAEDPVFFAREILEFDPTPKQARWLRAMGKEQHLVAGRRGGKSVTEAVKKLHRGLFSRSRFLNTARTYHQATIIPKEAEALCTRTEIGRSIIEDVTNSPFYMLRFNTGTEWWARSLQNGGDNIRGEWFHDVNQDEAAFGSKYDLSVILPTLADTRGSWSTTTTPNGLNWYHEVYAEAGRRMAKEAKRRGVDLSAIDRNRLAVTMLDHLALHWTSYENPFLTMEAIADMKARLSKSAIEQEIDAIFLEVEGALCKADDLAPVEDGGIRNDDLEWTNETEHQEGAVYVAGCDVGRWKSYTVMIVLRIDCKPWRVVSIVAKRRTGYEIIQAALEAEVERWRASALFDATKGSVGDVVFDYLNVPGDRFEFTRPSKDQLLLRLKLAIERRLLQVPNDEELLRQLGLYGTDPEGDKEETWDYVMALALAVWQAEQNPGGAGSIVTSSSGTRFAGLARGGKIKRFTMRKRPRGLWLPIAA